MAKPNDINLQSLGMLSIRPLRRRVRLWWLEHLEQHYLQCAAVEHQRAREAEQNEAYYQKRAAMTRSQQYSD